MGVSKVNDVRHKNPPKLDFIYFATVSQIKYRHYEAIFAENNIELRHGAVLSSFPIGQEIDDCGNTGKPDIVYNPLRQAARFVTDAGQTPYMLENTMLFIQHFSKNMVGLTGLPGADSENWWINLGSKGILDIMETITDRSAIMICQIGIYLGESRYKFAVGETEGVISSEIRVSDKAKKDIPYSNPFFFHEIFIPNDWSKTLAEMDGAEFSQVDYRRKAVRKFLSDNK